MRRVLRGGEETSHEGFPGVIYDGSEGIGPERLHERQQKEQRRKEENEKQTWLHRPANRKEDARGISSAVRVLYIRQMAGTSCIGICAMA